MDLSCHIRHLPKFRESLLVQKRCKNTTTNTSKIIKKSRQTYSFKFTRMTAGSERNTILRNLSNGN